MTVPCATGRRDTLVAGGCLGAAVLQVAPPVLVAWAGYGAGAAADAALVSVSSPVLLGIVAFGVALAVGLSRPGLEPRSDVALGPVDELGAPSAGHGPAGPVREGPPSSTLGSRVRWAAVATSVELAVLAAAVVLDGGATAGAASLWDSLDDGSAVWTFVLLVVWAGFGDLRAPVAFAVAMVVLTRGLRPVRPRRWPLSRRGPAARTTRSCPGRRPG